MAHSYRSWATGLFVIWLGLSVTPAARADAKVGLIGGQPSIAVADAAANGLAPYLVSLSQTADPPWLTDWLEHPTLLADDQVVESSGLAWFHDPFDVTPPYDLIPVPFVADAMSHAGYVASHGRLRARADASASLFPSSYIAVAPDERPPIAIPTPFFTGGFAGVGIYYWDELTFTSATLPVGTPIEVEVTLHHQSTLSTSTGVGGGPPFPNHAYSKTRFKLLAYTADWGYAYFVGDPLAVLEHEIVNGTIVREDPTQTVFVFDVAVGDHFFIDHQLEVWARATADSNWSQATSTADASNTAGASLRSLTDGVDIEAASGHTYTIPEPSLGLLLATGMAAIGRFAALRKRRFELRPRPWSRARPHRFP